MNYTYDPDHPIQISDQECENLYNAQAVTVLCLRAAAQLGADMQLEKCCEWLRGLSMATLADTMMAAMRPRPLSKREQAIRAIDTLLSDSSRVLLAEVLTALKSAREALMEGQGNG